MKKLAKKNVLVVTVSKTNHDRYGNRYSKVTSAYIIKPDQNKHERIEVNERSSWHTSTDQVGEEWVKKNFYNVTGSLWEHKNIVITNQIVTYRNLEKL